VSWRDQIKPQAVIVQRVLQTEHGKEFMALLQKAFQSGTLMGENMSETAYAVGQYELVEYLRELRDMEIADNE
jgi:hypothetical protein